MAITGEGPGRPPVKVGAPVTDITAGLLGAMGVGAAYAHKLKTGEGQRVDTSLFEAGIMQTYWQSAIAFATGVSPGPMGSAHPLNAPYQAFETSDGWIKLGAANQKTSGRFLVRARRAGDRRRRALHRQRRPHGQPPGADRARSLRTSRAHHGAVAGQLERAGIPAGPVLSVQEMHAHPQTVARDMVPGVEHPWPGGCRPSACR